MKRNINESIGNLLVSATMIYWGVTTVMMKHALQYMSSTTYIMLRFLIAAILVLPLYASRLHKNLNRSVLLHGCILGLLQMIPMESTTIALLYCSTANSVFVSQLSFVFVPLIQCILIKKKPERYLVLTGLSLITGLAIFADVLHEGIGIGSLLSLITALFNALNILCIKHFTVSDDPELLGVLQIVFCALFSMLIWLVHPSNVHWCWNTVKILFFTGVIGSAVAFVACAVGQSRITAIRSSFLGLLQPIFAMVGGTVLADTKGNTEPITWNMLIGAIIILVTISIFLACEEKHACHPATSKRFPWCDKESRNQEKHKNNFRDNQRRL